MIKLEGFDIKDEIYNGSSTIIYRAIDIKNDKKVIIKLLKSDYPTKDEIKKFNYEFEISNRLGIDGIIRNYSIIDYKNTKAIVMEDCGGRSIDKLIGGTTAKKLSLRNFLIAAIKITDILGKVHGKKIIHKDIKPHNILLNLDNGDIRIIDFSISTQLTKEQQELKAPEDLEGTLSYISPEQTGRMNRSVDYRSDFYSLGVTFYEMITGHVPFESDDPMELVHAHIAKIPVNPQEIIGEIPTVISDIIMKLLSKNAEDRYQSSYGLKNDFEKCYMALQNKGSVDYFKIGENDISDRFQIPEKLYGREEEIKKLMGLFEKITEGGKELLFISGTPGIGKSSLINELYKPVTEHHGYFIKGKYDQFKKNIPYTAIQNALQEFTKLILSESESSLKLWKNKILNAVGTNGQVVLDIVPEIEMIIGKQPEVQPLPPVESQNRFNMVFQNFVKVLSSKSNPLVLFLDDLQWADSASINLIKVLVTDPEIEYLLFIGSYRDTEVSSGHILKNMMESLEKEGVSYTDFKVTPLNEKSIVSIISDTLKSGSEEVTKLAGIINNKTNGNPFFVNEFFKNLYEEELITFKEGWKWDLGKIQSAGITNNVVELMTKKVTKLDKKALDILKIAACIGGAFNLKTLAVINEKTRDQVFSDLLEAFNEGFVLCSEDNARFVHDRVKEAAYSLISEKEAKEIHYKIGKELLLSAKDQLTDEIMFNVVNQWNLCKTLLNQDEKDQLIELNLKAGRKAKTSAAYELALLFVKHSIELLDKKCWEKNYSKTLEIYKELMENQYLNSNYDEVEKLFKILIIKTKSVFDKASVYSIQIANYTNQLRYKEAIDVGCQILKELGVVLPKNPSPFSALPDIIKFNMLLKKQKNINDIVDLPINNDIRTNLLMELMVKLIISSFSAMPNLFPVLIFKMNNISLKYGNTVFSSFSYICSAFLFAGALGNIKLGVGLAEMASKLSDKFGFKLLQGRVRLHVSWTMHWVLHPKENLNFLTELHEFADATGDIEYLNYCFYNTGFTYLLMGADLTTVSEVFEKYTPLILKFKQKRNIIYLNIYRQYILNLTGKSEDKFKFKSDFFDEDEVLPEIKNDFSGLAFFYFNKTALYYLHEEYSKSYENALVGEKAVPGLLGMLPVPKFYFFYALTLVELALISNKKNKLNYEKKFSAILKNFKKWGDFNKNHNYHRYLLLLAQFYRLQDDSKLLSNLYDQSIEVAKETGFLDDEAIANECAAKYYLSKGLKKIAGAYMIEARYCYEKWGAKAKVNQLNEKYSELLQGMGHATADTGSLSSVTASTSGRTTSRSGGTGALDIGTVMKASQALAGEIEMSRLLDRMIRILTENAGAQKGAFLLISEKGEMTIEAESFEDRDTVDVLKSIALDTAKTLSPAIVRYVARTKEAIVLNDASAEGTFTKDEYVVNKKPKSVLCVPITNQGKLIGVLYMENNLSAGAFTPARVETLKVLSAQAAISIENARLIHEMEDKARLQQEMEIAEHIQTSLCPPAPEHNELEIAAVMRPAEEVGGDYYDIVNDRNGDLWMAIGDVSGHGVTPGLIMMMAQTSFNTALDQSARITPADAIVSVNDILTSNVRMKLKEGHFMTMTFLKYQGKGKFQYAGAHLDIMVYRASSGKCEEFKTDGLFLALKKDIRSVTMDKEIELSKDDVMVVYTDGVIESRKAGNRDELWDSDNLIQVIESNGKKSCEEIKNAIVKGALDWCAGKPDDDITVVVVKMK